MNHLNQSNQTIRRTNRIVPGIILLSIFLFAWVGLFLIFKTSYLMALPMFGICFILLMLFREIQSHMQLSFDAWKSLFFTKKKEQG